MTLILITLNIAAFLLETADAAALIDIFALWPPASASLPGTPAFHVWQLGTYSFLHAGLTHLFFNMFGLYMFGRDVEAVLGRARLAIVYVASVATGGLAQLAVLLASPPASYPTIGASAGVFGLLLCYAVLFPRRRVVLLFPPVPMPAWLFAIVYAAVELGLGVTGTQAGVAHFAHLGGMLGAIVCLMLWWRRASLHRFD
ncbi:rhomboid family intramembrane serine protease [Trinickia caryophylli]|uniref:Membrane associated serine protease, rhomboid family n=1 Tax=Trinickia caryophylli TaxID=28094 RepID=A0A1X7GG65_TRICW|nr:rhomboid family intramembrane serine protease [Trinickia caryophylli]PMS08766.1 rhomboid family intramembrane serine protease [Trinickia caryophylli]TRX13906.1 rhomboid family intramembrane serine protease [Trinickia caryophylli]WQE15497.1 rhomboid family intramembrane serine protease [Trinickia caryophylli]SMF69189.1 Membrane associated serine protease, rhomboid family [Trinickia caryophylli]GLU33757.1 rhomboid family intramembrane serine protease [Trinickia caryophylli]